MKKIAFILFIVLPVAVCAQQTLKILAIGNSFSENAVEANLYEIAAADGVNLLIGNMFVGGCSLAMHYDNAMNNAAVYRYRKIVNGVMAETHQVALETAITDEAWDIITFQQVSGNSGKYDTYFPYLTDLKNYVTSLATNSNVQYALHMTWAYQQNYHGLASYGNDQITMFEAIAATMPLVAAQAGISVIIPAGTAIQNGRTSYLGDAFTSDGSHLENTYGRYTAACAWYEQLTGNSVVGNTANPASLSYAKLKIAQHAAHYAVQDPFNITDISGLVPVGNGSNYVLTAAINIDFGPSDRMTAAPWNNMTSVAQGTAIDYMLDINHNLTPLKIEIDAPFGAGNSFGPDQDLVIDDWNIPANAGYDTFYSEGANAPSFNVSNLNPAQKYDFRLFASRIDESSNRETAVQVVGGNKDDIVYVNASSNISKTANINEVQPRSDGTVSIIVTAGPNNNNSNKYFYANALQIAPSADYQETLGQSFYFDFGNNIGQETGTDASGHSWNNINSNVSGDFFALLNAENTASAYVLTLNSGFSMNTSVGGLAAADMDAAALGDLAVATAVADCIFLEGATYNTASFTVSGLTRGKGYRFYMFGSCQGTDARITRYTFNGTNEGNGLLQTTGSATGTGSYDGNNGKIYRSDMLFPDFNGNITVVLSREYGSFAYLNAMKMEEYAIATIQPTSITVSGTDVMFCGQTEQMQAKVLPAGAMYQLAWSVDDEDIACIDNTGLLHVKITGNVNVTATATYDGGSISDVISVTVNG
ncbi:MAG: DUF4886 domain-containing protein, partial [Bacteroidales bacterium]|nr:DUF4886 domain-containing protein [Bacteroidales bacterium]